MWHIVRCWHRAGENAEVDATMGQRCISLEVLREALAKDKPAAYDADEEVADFMAEHYAAVQQ